MMLSEGQSWQCEIEIQAKLGSKNKEIHKKIDNTNIQNFVTK